MKGGEAMNIGAMPIPLPNTSLPKASLNGGQKTTSSPQPFGEVFQKMMGMKELAPESKASTLKTNLSQMLNANSVEEIFQLLGITFEDGFVFPKGEEVMALEDLMNVEDMLAIFQMDLKQFNEELQHLLGKEVNIQNLSDFLQLVNEEFPMLQVQLQASLQKGGEEVKEAERLLQLVKLTQLTSEETGFSIDQPEKLVGLQKIVQAATHMVEKTITTKEASIDGFQKIIQMEVVEVPNQPNAQGTVTRTVTVTLPNAERATQAEELVKQIEALINRSALTNKQGTIKLLLKLYPEQLGSIRIEFMQKEGMLTARLLASTAIGKEMLDSQLHQLKQSLVQQNIQLDRIDIQQSLQETDFRDQSLFGNLFKQQSQREDDEKQDEHQEEQDQISFQELLENEEV